MLWPQEWAFFANAADAPTEILYSLSAGNPVLRLQTPRQASRTNLSGLRSTGRTQLLEVSYLIMQVPSDRWVNCADAASTSCRAVLTSQTPYQIVNDFGTATICGTAAVGYADPRRWPDPTASQGDPHYSARLAFVAVSCAAPPSS